MTNEQMKAELERLKAENEQLKTKKAKPFGLKVSAKGAVSVYGMGRFPVTLYKQQWERLLDHTDDIKSFIKDNEADLTTK